jgi:protein-tyrosine-phosphatase
MAEAFARAYGADVIEPASAGLAPASIIQPLTIRTLEERNIRINGQFPKGPDAFPGVEFDLIVNMTGDRIPVSRTRVLDWKVRDPMGQKPEVYRAVADQIEQLVMRLILDYRKPGRVDTAPASG